MSAIDPPDEVLEVLHDGKGRLYADAEPLPELPEVLEQAGQLAGLAVADTSRRRSWRTGGEWILTFTYQDHRFGIHTDYHAGLTRYSSPDPDCSEALLRQVVAHFESVRLRPPSWVPPPPLTGHRLLGLFLFALATAAALVLFLVLSRPR